MPNDSEILKRIDEAFKGVPIPPCTTMNLLENSKRILERGFVIIFRYHNGCACVFALVPPNVLEVDTSGFQNLRPATLEELGFIQ